MYEETQAKYLDDENAAVEFTRSEGVTDKREGGLNADEAERQQALYMWDKPNQNEWRYRTKCEGCNKDFTVVLTASAISSNPEKDKEVQARMRQIEQERKCWNCRQEKK